MVTGGTSGLGFEIGCEERILFKLKTLYISITLKKPLDKSLVRGAKQVILLARKPLPTENNIFNLIFAVFDN